MDENKKQEIAININLDTTPILYTDNILLTTNEDGLVLGIGQKLGLNQLRIVSRVGMSRIHAKKFLKELGSLLAMTDGSVHTGEEKKKKN